MGDRGDPASIEEPPFPLTDVDKWVLSQTDEEFKYHNWDELREIIGKSNREQAQTGAWAVICPITASLNPLHTSDVVPRRQ